MVRRRISLKIGRTLLVDGPATVQVSSGIVNVMGAVFTEGSLVKVRSFRRTPFYAEHSDVELALDGEKYHVVEGSTMPSSWMECAEKTVGEEAPLVAIVGGVDSGKTSLATLLANYYLNFHGEIGIVDGDLGQNDLGVPGTVSAGVVNKGISDLSQVKPEVIEFVGSTAPEWSVSDLNDAVVKAIKRIWEMGIRKIVLNTDGWVDSGGLKHKVELVKIVKPSFVVSLLEEEHAILFTRDVDPSIKIIQVEKPPYVKRRSRMHRRFLRMQSYRRYFKRLRLVRISFKEAKFVEHPFLNGEPFEVSEELVKKLGITEARSYMGIVYARTKQELEEPVMIGIDGKIILLGENWERGLLVGLGRENKTLGVGVIEEIRESEIVVKTPLASKFDWVELGEIKLDSAFNERSFRWKPR
jgi:polynucleotide 5'-hydroxyl-kinase GRC3/NOL9